MLLASDPKAQYLTYKAEIDVAIARVLRKGWYILGEEVESFEREFAAYLGVNHAVGVGNGTEALRLALTACGVGAGDEVITVSHTAVAVATVAAIETAGAVPVLVDIEPGGYTLDVAKLEAAITPKTRAVVPVHLYGQPADLGPILAIARSAGIKVVEDCAQATSQYQGKKVGGWGDVYHLYVVRAPRRDALQAFLQDKAPLRWLRDALRALPRVFGGGFTRCKVLGGGASPVADSSVGLQNGTPAPEVSAKKACKRYTPGGVGICEDDIQDRRGPTLGRRQSIW